MSRAPTAILLFSRTAGEEAVAKRLAAHGSKTPNTRIADALIRHSAQTARTSGMPLVCAFSDAQRGGTFGERLAGAVEDVFAQGYEKVIVVGNDCPAITPALLLHAAARLRITDTVLGPAADGGVYLIGLTRWAYCREAFLTLPWLTDGLFAAFEIEAGEDAVILPREHDIDDAAGLAKWLRNARPSSALVRAIRAILSTRPSLGTSAAAGFESRSHSAANVLRGPPAHAW